MSTVPGWENILDTGETILWQGRPDGGIVLRSRNILTLIFGLFFAGFAVFWMIMAAQGGGGFWMFGLIHFSVGVGIAFSAIGWGAFLRRRSWYTLTDRRAFVATDLPLVGKRLKSYPITEETVLELVDGDLATVNFASITKRSKNGTRTVPIGFERIPDGRGVYRMMRDIQAKAGSSTESQQR